MAKTAKNTQNNISNMEDLKNEVIAADNKEQATAQEAKPKKKLPRKKAQAKTETPKKEKAIKAAAKQQSVDLIEKVVSNREVKWIYPEDCTGSLERKSWRQKQRNKIHKMERELARIGDQNSKEYKSKLKELRDFQKTVLKKVS